MRHALQHVGDGLPLLPLVAVVRGDAGQAERLGEAVDERVDLGVEQLDDAGLAGGSAVGYGSGSLVRCPPYVRRTPAAPSPLN